MSRLSTVPGRAGSDRSATGPGHTRGTVEPTGSTLGYMTTGVMAVRLSGRTPEQSALREAVDAGLAGQPRAVLVHGEAGIGKTALLRDLCDQVPEGTQVLWGQSLRFGTVEAMYHPLVLALEAWLARGGEERRTTLLDEVPAASLILPSLGAVP